jgi:putative SOS response-associated peptidase YedK
MCASYMIKARNPGQFGVAAEMRIQIDDFVGKLIVPYTAAPVLVAKGDGQMLSAMKFSLVPSWSKEPKVKFATHNARLESIDEKPTWKKVFSERHCLIPLTDFIEPIYEGELAGNMVAFHAKSGTTLYAAGVWDEWVNKATGEVLQSFAIITFDPPPFVAGVGHDRCPIFLSEQDGAEWLANTGTSGKLLKDFLLARKSVPELDVTPHRPLKAGWEKRK